MVEEPRLVKQQNQTATKNKEKHGGKIKAVDVESMERLPKKPFAVINADECCFFVSLFCFVLFCFVLFVCLFVCLLAFLGVFCLFVGLFCCFVCLVWFLDLCCPLSGFVPFPNGRTPWDDPPSGPLRFIPQVVVA